MTLNKKNTIKTKKISLICCSN